MADEWEDWEAADIDAKIPAVPVAATNNTATYETKGDAIRAQMTGPDMSKFAEEDKDFETAAPAPNVPAPQPKKKEEKKYRDPSRPLDTPLDDPLAEKLRQQKLVEQGDFDAARELFGDVQKPLNSYLPKSVKEFEDFAYEIVGRHVTPFYESKNYKVFVKALVKAALEPLPADEVKDVETCVAGVKADKIKAEKAAAAAKVTAKGGKKDLNMGKSGKAAGDGLSAGLDDYQYADDYDDGEDFM